MSDPFKDALRKAGERQRPTPETDAAKLHARTPGDPLGAEVVHAAVSESIERQRDEALELLASEKATRNAIIAKARAEVARLQMELDASCNAEELRQVREENARLREALQRIADCIDAPDIDPVGETQFGLHCGVEDRNCTDRYDGADYGYSCGVERTLEWASNEAKHALTP